MTSETPPAYGRIAAELADRDAEAFVHIGDRYDDVLRYLVRFAGPDRPYAVVVRPDGEPTLCAPPDFERAARRAFPGRVVSADEQAATTAGGRAAELLKGGRVLAPQHLPHDAALRLEGAGCTLESTDVVARMRVRKTEGEIEQLRDVQRAARAGMARAKRILAEATVGDGSERLHWKGEPLTTERLRRETNAELVRAGASDAHNTAVGVGETCTERRVADNVPVEAGETVLIDLSPCGPEGYHGALSRTFVVDSEGGWERRAHVAVERAREAALSVLSAGAGTVTGTVHEEAAAEVAAYGFRPDGEPGLSHEVGHGVGLSLHEAPSLRGTIELEAGTVLAVEPGVYDRDRGGVRIGDLVVVREDGFEVLADHPRSLVPG